MYIYFILVVYAITIERDSNLCRSKKKTKNWHMSQAHHFRDDTLISAGESHSLILHYLVNNKRLLLIKNFVQTLCIQNRQYIKTSEYLKQ